MSKGITINPEVLVWARERAGYSTEQLTQSFPKLCDWETGMASPTYSQLGSLSEKYKITIAVLLFPSIPRETPIEKSLRSVVGTDISKLSPKIRLLFRKGEAFQIYLRELYQDNLQEQEQKISWLEDIKGDTPTAMMF